jgi:hypothetical protein
MPTKSQLSARPGRGKAKKRNLKQRASARPALGHSRRRSKPAALILQSENDRLRKLLAKLRDHSCKYATQWADGGGSNNHPIWAEVTDAAAPY